MPIVISSTPHATSTAMLQHLYNIIRDKEKSARLVPRMGDLVRARKKVYTVHYPWRGEDIDETGIITRIDDEGADDIDIDNIIYNGRFVVTTYKDQIRCFSDQLTILNRITIGLKEAISLILNGKMKLNLLLIIKEILIPGKGKEVYAALAEQSAIAQLKRQNSRRY